VARERRRRRSTKGKDLTRAGGDLWTEIEIGHLLKNQLIEIKTEERKGGDLGSNGDGRPLNHWAKRFLAETVWSAGRCGGRAAVSEKRLLFEM